MGVFVIFYAFKFPGFGKRGVFHLVWGLSLSLLGGKPFLGGPPPTCDVSPVPQEMSLGCLGGPTGKLKLELDLGGKTGTMGRGPDRVPF